MVRSHLEFSIAVRKLRSIPSLIYGGTRHQVKEKTGPCFDGRSLLLAQHQAGRVQKSLDKGRVFMKQTIGYEFGITTFIGFEALPVSGGVGTKK
jgi:hypothetical protein